MVGNVTDPMGQAICDYYNKKKLHRLRVDSSFTEDEEIEIDYLFRDFDQMPKIEQKALQECSGNVLDIGAGAGSHSLWLQNNGFEVLPIEISELSVKTMHQRGITKAKCEDFFKLNSVKFDTLLLLMNGVGIAGHLLGLDKLLEHSKTLLKQNGQILLDSSDIIYLFDGVSEFSTEPGEYYGEFQYQMQYGNLIGKPFDWLFVGFELLTTYAEKHGFNCQKVQEGDHFDYLARLTIK